MDKYEFNIKLEQIKKLNNKKDYITAMKIADTIDWRKVKNAKILSFISQVYQYNEEYGIAKETLLMAYERAPVGKRILYKLVELMIKEGNLEEADIYFKEFKEVSGSDPRQYLLQYMMLTARGMPTELLIPLLENYKKYEFDEKWSYELAELYHKAGRERECVSLCDSISLWFGVGKYVEKALKLKLNYESLTRDQQELLDNKNIHEEKLKAVEKEFQELEMRREAAIKHKEQQEKAAGVRVKKDEILKEVEEDSIEADIEEILELDQEKLAQEVAKMDTSEFADDLKLPMEAANKSDGETLEELYKEADKEAEEEIEKEVEEDAESEVEKEEEIENEAKIESDEDIIGVHKEEGQKKAYHILVRSSSEEEGLKLAVGALKKMHKDTGTPVNKIAKISGEKLNDRGLLNSMDKLAGKDLVISHASELNNRQIDDLGQTMDNQNCPIVVVLIDTAQGIKGLQERYPDLTVRFSVLIGDSEQLEVKEFVNHARNYATELDCILDEMAVLAIYALAEERAGDGLGMTEADAENMIEEAAETAEKKTIKKMLVGVFSSRYNKDGQLILKEEHFK